MANTYHQIYLQMVYTVKYRKAMINKSWGSKGEAHGEELKVETPSADEAGKEAHGNVPFERGEESAFTFTIPYVK